MTLLQIYKINAIHFIQPLSCFFHHCLLLAFALLFCWLTTYAHWRVLYKLLNVSVPTHNPFTTKFVHKFEVIDPELDLFIASPSITGRLLLLAWSEKQYTKTCFILGWFKTVENSLGNLFTPYISSTTFEPFFVTFVT